MKVAVARTGMGKTTVAILQAHYTDAYIVVATLQEARHVFDMAAKMGLKIRYPVTVEEAFKMHNSYVRNVVIDNADRVLAQIFSHLHIEMVTLNEEGQCAAS